MSKKSLFKNIQNRIDNLRRKIKQKESNIFDNFILIVITISAILIGFETNHELALEYHDIFYYSDLLVLGIFVFEIVFKWYAYYPEPWNYFKDSWNVFDFTIVVMSVLPHILHSSVNVEAIIILRILRFVRVFRVFRFISVLKPLQMLVSIVFRSLPSMGYVALLILILFYVYGVIGVFLFHETDPDHYSSLMMSILTLFQTITGEGWPDLLAIQIEKNNTAIASVFYVSFIVIGSMVILNLLIGIIVSELDNLKEMDAKGKQPIKDERHIVILGWSSKLFYLVTELMEANSDKKGTVITILADKRKHEMRDYFKHHKLHQKGVYFVFRTGQAFEKRDLEMINIQKASSVIILNDKEKYSDNYVIKVLIVVVNLLDSSSNNQPIITLPIKNDKNDSIVKLISNNNVFDVLVDDVISRIIAQTCRQVGLSTVYDEILSFLGHEIYAKGFEDIEGEKFEDVVNSFNQASVIGIRTSKGEIKINPPFQEIIQRGDKVIAISERESTFLLDNHNVNKNNNQLEICKNPFIPKSENVLIIGGNHLIYSIISELDSYISHGSSISIYTNDEFFKYDNSKLSKEINTQISVLNIDTESREELEIINFEKFDYIILLTYSDKLDADDADSAVIILWLYIRDILKQKNISQKPIVTEMLNNKNEHLARPTEWDDFVIIDKIDSRLLAQFSQNSYLKEVYDILFDEEDSEIYLKPAKDYVELGKKYAINEISKAVNKTNELFIGYKKNNLLQEDIPIQNIKNGVKINPSKTDEIIFEEGDKVIVVAAVEYGS